ncbi:methionyl-tRNA formyltransferase, partial [Rhodovulum sulfidophilum]|uniref:methionyl-tRNA formyltransferase n=1 Tax=Rhodovulum sulfidophilum TaxID=35806 RepID=UPI001EED6FDB
RKDRPSPVQARAEELGLMVRHPKSLRATPEQTAFAALDPDVAVVVAYGLILPREVLEAPCRGCLNIHASLLPRWRGAAPIHRAIMAGDTQTGVCIMEMEEGLDTGPVLLRETTAIGPEDTTGALHDRLSAMGARLVVEALERLRDLPREPQPAEGVTYAAKIDKAEAKVDWTRPAPEVAHHINGLSPFPGAWCDVAGERLKLLRARAVEARMVEDSADPGTVLDGLTIACGEGAVEIIEAQRQGKRPMSAAEILRGFPLPERLD